MKYIYNDSDKNKHEALDKSEVIALLQQVVEQGQLPQDVLNGVVIALRNSIDNQDYKIAFCTQAKYNELSISGQLEGNCYYFITDDTTITDIDNQISQLGSDLNTINNNVGNIQIKISKDSVSPSNITQAGIYAISAFYTEAHEDFGITETMVINDVSRYLIQGKYFKYTRANGIQLLPDYQGYNFNECYLIYKF